MNRHLKVIALLGIVALFVAEYLILVDRKEERVDYQISLYTSLNDRSRESFFVAHHCTSGREFRLCPEAGLAFQVEREDIVRRVYFYIHSRDIFPAYSGKLPFGLEPADTMKDVQYKLGYPKMPDLPMLGWELGLPDTGSSPDHFHYWATYKQYNLTIVYNTVSPTDVNADIYLIMISIDPALPMYRGHSVIF